MSWLQEISEIEALEDAEFDADLITRFEARAAQVPLPPIRFSTPTFKSYGSGELSGCSKMSFPAFSVTGGACALDCDHCQARILDPMIPAFSPEELDEKVRRLVDTQDLDGFLLSGGSNRKNEIRYERFLPTIEGLKRDFPHLRIAIHSALIDRERAQGLADAGFDTAMLDIIGAQETVSEVYHLERPVDDFEQSLAALCETSMEVVPHIVIGLHYGRILGELNALEMIARHSIQALVLVVVMPYYAKPGTFETPSADAVGEIFLQARERIPDRQVLLGCARPAGMHKRVTDAYAVMAGLDGIAFPAEGVVATARAVGREFEQAHACCSVKLAHTPMTRGAAAATA